MGTHNICFCGEIKNISVFFSEKKCLILIYGFEGLVCMPDFYLL